MSIEQGKEKSKCSLALRENISLIADSNSFISEVIKNNTFTNPKHVYNTKNGFSNFNIPEKIKTYEFKQDALVIPTGYLSELLQLFTKENIPVEIQDRRISKEVAYPDLINVSLRPYQEAAISKALQSNCGCIISPTGSGKTLIAIELLRRRGQKALIIVHRKELLAQWVSVLQARLGITVGTIQSTDWSIGNEVTVAMIQTLSRRKDDLKAIQDNFGVVLLDEAHHSPAKTFFDVIGQLPARYKYGVSATPRRRDGLESLLFRSIGPVLVTVEKQEVEDSGSIVPAKVELIETGFQPGPMNNWCDYLDQLCGDQKRNQLIIDLIRTCKSSVLVLCDRVAHAQNLSNMLSIRNINHVLAHGKLDKQAREELMDKIRKTHITIGTTGLLGEGLDVSHWAALILASPISSEIKLMQAIGRIIRPAEGKEIGLVYDLKDDCGFAGASFKSRYELYKKNNIWVRFPNKNNKAAGNGSQRLPNNN